MQAAAKRLRLERRNVVVAFGDRQRKQSSKVRNGVRDGAKQDLESHGRLAGIEVAPQVRRPSHEVDKRPVREFGPVGEAAGVQPAYAECLCALPDRAYQARLANAGLAGDSDDAAFALSESGQCLVQRGELAVTPDKRRPEGCRRRALSDEPPGANGLAFALERELADRFELESVRSQAVAQVADVGLVGGAADSSRCARMIESPSTP